MIVTDRAHVLSPSQDTLASFLGGATLEGQGALVQPPAQDDAKDEVVDPEGQAAAEAPLDDFFGGGGAVQVTTFFKFQLQ